MKKGRNQAVFTIIFMVFATLFSKVLGLFRTTMTASIFAAGVEGIAFSAASKIPFALFDMLFSSAILGSFVPIYCGHLLSDEKRARAFSSSFFTFTGCITAITAVFGVIFARPILSLAAPNLDAETFALAVSLLRIMFPSVIFAGMAYTVIGVMQSHERFLLPAMISAVSNAVILLYLVICMGWEEKRTAVLGLAAVYLISWIVQFLTLAIPLIRSHNMPSVSLKFTDSDLICAQKRALPVMFGAWLIPMITLTANAFSSYIDTNTIGLHLVQGAAIVVFEHAFSVFSIAGGLMTYGICNYLFPKLSAKFSKGDKDGFSSSARMGLALSLLITIPLTSAIFITSDEIIRFLFFRGDFTKELADAAARSLKMLSLALPAYSTLEFLSRTAYSGGHVKIPLIGTAIGILSAWTSSLFFLQTKALSVSSVAFCAGLGIVLCALTDFLLSLRLLAVSFTRILFKKFCIWFIGTMLSAWTMQVFHEFLKKFFRNAAAFENLLTIAIVFIFGFMVYLIWIFLFRHFLFSKNQTERRTSSGG